MIVITLTDCPPKCAAIYPNGYWKFRRASMSEISAPVVRDELWGRVCEHVKEGRATMVYSSNGGAETRLCNSQYQLATGGL